LTPIALAKRSILRQSLWELFHFKYCTAPDTDTCGGIPGPD
jgi:hypothetical protein